MPPRFFSSPYKNAIAVPAKKENYWSELQISTNAKNDRSDLIQSGTEYWLALSSTTGHLVCLPFEGLTGKLNHSAPSIQVAPRAITSFSVSRFGNLLAAGTEDGKIYVTALPSLESLTSSPLQSPSPLIIYTSSTGRSIDNLQFHPTTSNLLLSTSQSSIEIYDVSSKTMSPAFSILSPTLVWSCEWSLEGRYISTTSKDCMLRIYDVRSNTTTAVMETAIHQGMKCSRHVWLANDQILTTGFSKMRDREYSLFDVKNLSKAMKTNRIDSGTGVIMPIADVERGIVYFAGRGDMTLRWVEVGGPSILTEGGCPLPHTIASFCLIPPPSLSLMSAEINRVMIVTTDAVVPISINVPRRQYLDFHHDIYPDFRAFETSQTSMQWVEGNDKQLEMIKHDPAIKGAKCSTSSTPSATTSVLPLAKLEPAIQSQIPVPFSFQADSLIPAPLSIPSPSPISKPVISEVIPLSPAPPTQVISPCTSSAPKVDVNRSLKVAAVATSPTPPTLPINLSTSANRFNPNWSRKFIGGKTPLKADYFGLHSLSSMNADIQMLKANHLYAFFPLSGPGGRLGVHSLAVKGRFAVSIKSFIAGANIVDFELDPFDSNRVFIASDDSRIRVFKIPRNGLEQDLLEVEIVFGDDKMDRISEVKHHPTAKNLLLSVSDDHGNPAVRIWNVESGAILKKVDLPFGGVSSIAWSPDGSLLAVATKSKTLLVFDPRSSSTFLSCSTHDSIRPVRVVWCSDNHLITTGFSKTAMREMNLYSISVDSSTITKFGTQSLDVSPAILFSHFDLDTNILLLYARGERSLHLFEVQPENPKAFFTRLPSFENGTLQVSFAFGNKARNDIKGIEVIKGLRLTKETLEVVSFTVPRAKVQFFQDDIFIPTRDVETPTLSAEEWISGKNLPLKKIDLTPQELELLSKAPATVTKGSTRSQITGPVLTESQIQEAYMARMFQAAKLDEEEEEIPVRSANAVVDDDDW